MRLTIARRLQASKRDAPHFRVVVDVEVDALLALQQALGGGQQVTINDLLVKACAASLMEVPACNVQFDGAVLRRFSDADIAVAVAVDDGLITPIVRAANRKPLAEISSELRELVGRARAGRLQAGEFEGGTFSISNLGMYGVRQFDAVINPPQAVILAVGAAGRRVVVRDEQPAVASVMTLSLSSDHRVIDGATAAKFLAVLQRLLEQPQTLAD
jgi:pyruvate dehydrogenase E2 component (dihydrolipoamide acetyltransferase)